MNQRAGELLQSAVRHHQSGQLQSAEKLYNEVLSQFPGSPEAHCNLGILLHGTGNLETAAEHLQRAVVLNPNLAPAWNNLGVVLRKLHRVPEAVRALSRALQISPQSSGAHHNLALLYIEESDFEPALHHALKATELAPGDPSIAVTVGDVLLQLNRPKDAVSFLQQLARKFPDHPGPYNGLGMAFLACNELADAELNYRRVLEFDPDLVEAHFCLGVIQLLRGDLQLGLPDYEWRLQRPQNSKIVLKQAGAPWTGQELKDRTIQVFTEQGFGDVIQAARYLPMLKPGRLVLRVPQPLQRLLATMEIKMEITGPEAIVQGVDFNVSIMSLAHRLGTTLTDIPEGTGYLKPPIERIMEFNTFLGTKDKPRVGICWRGNPRHAHDRKRSIPVSTLDGLIDNSRVEWINLQVPSTPEDRAFLPDRHGLGKELGDFLDTACLIKNLDLVVTVDTSVAHLAGALGVPTFVLLPFAPDWRWMLERSDSPWYPTIRLFRQDRPGAWDSAVNAVACAIEEKFDFS